MDHQHLEVVGMEVLDDLIVQFSTLLDTTIIEERYLSVTCYYKSDKMHKLLSQKDRSTYQRHVRVQREDFLSTEQDDSFHWIHFHSKCLKRHRP